MCRSIGLVVAAGIAAGSIRAQGPEAGFRDEAWPNTSGAGSTTLTARVYYPATAAGAGTPIVPRPGGHPVVVFLHGFATLGSWYPALGEELARAGFVAVLSNTAQFASGTQADDGRALLPALAAANAGPGFFQGALDTGRAGLCGHSMGGGNVLEVLGDRNPGYLAGVTLAAVNAVPAALAVSLPLLMLHGTGDSIVPWSSSATNFDAALAFRGCKALYVLNADATHTNVAGFFQLGVVDREVFARCMAATAGFFGRWLEDAAIGLDAAVGANARAEPRLGQLRSEYETAQTWQDAPARLGATVGLGIGAEPGPAALFAAATTADLPTPWGSLRLDPATLLLLAAVNVGPTRFVAVPVAVPADPQLVGQRLPIQPLVTLTTVPSLGRMIEIELVP